MCSCICGLRDIVRTKTRQGNQRASGSRPLLGMKLSKAALCAEVRELGGNGLVGKSFGRAAGRARGPRISGVGNARYSFDQGWPRQHPAQRPRAFVGAVRPDGSFVAVQQRASLYQSGDRAALTGLNTYNFTGASGGSVTMPSGAQARCPHGRHQHEGRREQHGTVSERQYGQRHDRRRGKDLDDRQRRRQQFDQQRSRDRQSLHPHRHRQGYRGAGLEGEHLDGARLGDRDGRRGQQYDLDHGQFEDRVAGGGRQQPRKTFRHLGQGHG